ncbi:MAG TPA: phosphoribosylformylglycinamidine synthase subunit PurS, partial [Tepidisphaeraceae bacterium]|nr:phosphoribosylformylglycinamidine synthase subunit PurS [Tepidisphaeraceae bacterium]
MIWRVEIASKPSIDSHERALEVELKSAGFETGRIERVRIFFIESDSTREQIEQAFLQLADPIVDEVKLMNSSDLPSDFSGSIIEIHLKPGVMDPAAGSTELALRTLGLHVGRVQTGRQFRFSEKLEVDVLNQIARRFLASPVIEEIRLTPQPPTPFSPLTSSPTTVQKVHVCNQPDTTLNKISRDRQLLLNLEEMRTIKSHFKQLNREPTDVELETLAQTWSEHCIHKTMKSAVDVLDESGNVIRSYNNLIKETIFDSTMKLIEQSKNHFALSVFKDNAGVIVFDDVDAICFKVETHNRPSAIEPYGGASTGIGGCIRDILGTGLSAQPIASTSVFCVAYPDTQLNETPVGAIHPKRILEQVVAGVRDYGNRMGIPTVNGAVYFDENYIANPLVFCGCVGIIPKNRIEKRVCAGDAIVLIGGRTGRDGIHGATFSSGELTDKHASEFSHAVQIGNPITQKMLMDVLLQARDRALFTSITDCGAGGLSSAVGEMGAELGAEVDLDLVPLKYAGLRYDEIWISESQERMLLSVPSKHVDELIQLARDEDVEATVIGKFGNPDRELVARFHQTEVIRLSMDFIHTGIPMPKRKAKLTQSVPPFSAATCRVWQTRESLLSMLAHPNIASKHWIIRQYDHEVQAATIIKPLIGPQQIGPSDASVIRPKFDSHKGIVIACGLQPHIDDPYEMALASIDEAI